jgi:enamine deaminase RidA (YjgF/YER057c/UK114 family)
MERRIVNPWTWQDQFGFVQANETSGVERVLVCSGQTSVDADGQPMHEGDMGAQVAQALDNLESVLTEAGFALADVVRLNYYVTDVEAFLQAGEGLRCEARPGRLPPSVHSAGGVATRVAIAAGRDRGNRCAVGPLPYVAM